MKRFIICIIIVGMMLVLACGCYLYTQSVADNIGQRLADIKVSYENGDNDRVKLISREVTDSWRSYCTCRVFVTDNDSVREITSAIMRMSAMIESDDDGFINECLSAISLTEIYRENQSLNFCNIF